MLLSFAAAGLALANGLTFLPLVAVSLLVNLWSIVRSESKGFVRAREVRRIDEPPRNFSHAQSFSLLAVSMGEILLAVYLLIR